MMCNKSCRLFLSLFIFAAPFCTRAQQAAYEVPEIAGAFVNVFNPNDSRFLEDTPGTPTIIALQKVQMANGMLTASSAINQLIPGRGETRLFHASGPSLKTGHWTDHGDALTALPGKERVLWAPHIIKEKDTWYMFYNIGNLQENAPDYSSWGQLCLATSKDLFTWTRHDHNPLFSDAGHARDSYILKDDGKFYYYYTRTFSEVDQRSTVAVRTGNDLLHWSGPQVVHVQPLQNHYGGDAESSFVIKKDGLFYLFICRANTNYNRTDVYWSKDLESFPVENFVCQLPVHAAEIMQDEKDGWFISNTGWDKKGLYTAPLVWKAVGE